MSDAAEFLEAIRTHAKTGGTKGAGGTPNVYAASGCPTSHNRTWDTVGQTDKPQADAMPMGAETSHLSHNGKNKVGHCKPSVYAAVPLVPPENSMNEIEREAFEDRAAIMEYDGGLSRTEAELLAAIHSSIRQSALIFAGR